MNIGIVFLILGIMISAILSIEIVTWTFAQEVNEDTVGLSGRSIEEANK